MGVEDTSKLRIVIPSVTDRALIKMSNMTDSKLHHILSSAIARQASKDVYNLEIKLKDMIRGIVFICLRNTENLQSHTGATIEDIKELIQKEQQGENSVISHLHPR
eukprot:GHVP01019235.1.p2 GENE.GHVP01019235.1~~GHVP01019235.1.p2  ORF type:complete len:106 (-),score=6.57 GHVP01019235.1:201-518(-)